MYCSDQTDRERRRCWKEIIVVLIALLTLWGASALLTTQPPTITEITQETLLQADLSTVEQQIVLTGLNETLYSDLSLLNHPDDYRRHVENLVAQVQ